ncbi:hypothetical protein [Caldivirga maquilingensis]|uniref:Uncharacterized protein n=1 Tax=Caldivirga maquilingensis (strain ATCC 700844 / DSM 13496 / JCM 10307 / IC-167) TaxID=397948 RepID=A8M9Z1_CALMQ|nr:hypothetical protein [Caldivirga maquilingensis]ABW02462.1 hypothetical protein Cmaq_1639 [Caldivirga maquilingensis IC-167]
MLLPFYRIKKDLWIEAYLIGRVDALAKVGLIKSFKTSGVDNGELKPIPYQEIKSIISNDIKWINDTISDLENGLKFRFRDYVLIPVYNPGQYMAKVNLSLMDIVTLRVTRRIYENLLKVMPKEPLGVGWFNVAVENDTVFIDGVYDEALTNTYTNNESLRRALMELLSGNH